MHNKRIGLDIATCLRNGSVVPRVPGARVGIENATPPWDPSVLASAETDLRQLGHTNDMLVDDIQVTGEGEREGEGKGGRGGGRGRGASEDGEEYVEVWDGVA